MVSLSLANLLVPSSIINYWQARQLSLQFQRNGFLPSPSPNPVGLAESFSLSSPPPRVIRKAANANACSLQWSSDPSSNVVDEEGEETYQVLAAVRSKYNEIVIIDTPKARMLLLDSTHNVHSILNKGQIWTGSYWDEFAALPAIIPEGPVAIFGLGGGTAAHLMLDLWPSLYLDGWEIDEILIDKAREYFGLSELEKQTQAGGILQVHIGDALCLGGNSSRQYAGIVIDLFCEGKVLPQLQEVETWLELNDRLLPNGRFMVNCGGVNDMGPRITLEEDSWIQNPAIKALSEVFGGQLCWKRMPETQGANYLALTGTLPDLTSWSAMLPDSMGKSVKKWKRCGPLHDIQSAPR